ncbi:MAG: acyl-CoA thioesterase [Alphaproteobacteria bacterium]|nr:MAG: acyl-CoA thioesterase [Alphaproteobacteria bacterium]
MSRKRTTRDQYASFGVLTTRWHDNDVYGHMNNVVYYALFDTVVNRWLKLEAGLPVPEGDLIGLVVQTACTYHESLGWPEPVEAGLCTERVGRSSITYRVGLFRPDADRAAAEGHFTHVYVDAETRRPVPLPDFLRRAADAIWRDHG